MQKLIYSMMVSLDGFIESPDHSIDWITIDEEIHTFANDQAKRIGYEIYGRRMFALMNAFWPTADLDPLSPAYIVEFAHIWKNTPKIVFSKTLNQVEGNAVLTHDTPAQVLTQLKSQTKMDISVSGANMAANFIRLGLIDEYQFYVQPLILGGGTPMLPSLKKALNLDLIETHTFQSGVIFQRYQSQRV